MIDWIRIPVTYSTHRLRDEVCEDHVMELEEMRYESERSFWS